MPSPFEELLNDLAAVQAMRRPSSRDTAARAARRIRPVCATAARPLKKAAPVPDYRKPDWDSLTARQNAIAADLEQSRIQAQRDAIREHLRTLRQAAQAGRLSSFEAAKYDALVGQALRMGLQP